MTKVNLWGHPSGYRRKNNDKWRSRQLERAKEEFKKEMHKCPLCSRELEKIPLSPARGKFHCFCCHFEDDYVEVVE